MTCTSAAERSRAQDVPRARRRPLAAVLAVVVALQSGCAGPVVQRPPDLAAIGRVVVVADANPPQLLFTGFARSGAEGAVKGAGATFADCAGGMAGAGSCGGGGWACGAAYLILLAACGVASVVGGIAGAATAPDADTAQAAVSRLSAAAVPDALQDTLRDNVVAIAKSRGTPLATVAPAAARVPAGAEWLGPLAERGIDAVLIVALTQVGTAGRGVGGPLALRIDADARLVRTSNQTLLFSSVYSYLDGQRTLAEWSAKAGAPFASRLAAGVQRLASRIHSDVFMLYPFPDRATHAEGFAPAVFGLAPLAPALSAWSPTTVDELRPTLRWEAFPRAGDLEAAPGEMQRVTEVRYDLVIARAVDAVPGEIVYQRDALEGTRHRLETALEPEARYLWSVRARFVLDGRERVTEWGERLNHSRRRESVPSRWSYVFQTPDAQPLAAE
jgi:hypothetical protein